MQLLDTISGEASCIGLVYQYFGVVFYLSVLGYIQIVLVNFKYGFIVDTSYPIFSGPVKTPINDSDIQEFFTK